MSTEIVERDPEVLTIVDAARSLKIDNNNDYLFVDGFLTKAKDLKNRIKARWEEPKGKAKAAHQAICDSEKAELGIVEEAILLVNKTKHAWEAKQEEIRRAEEDRLRIEAKKKADEEALRTAEAVAKCGDVATANAILEEAAAAPAPMVKLAPVLPKAKNVTQTRQTATVTNPNFVRDAIVEAGRVLSRISTKEAQEAAEALRLAYQDATYMVYNQVAINQLAVATKGAIKLGGVTFSSRKV